VEAVLIAAQQQQLRHLRRLQQMRRQAETKASVQAAWREKQQAEEQKRLEREAEIREVRFGGGWGWGVKSLQRP